MWLPMKEKHLWMKATAWSKWQADALATALLMPLPQIKRSFYRLRAGRSNEQLVAEMAQIFQVSKQAMRIRLETRNLI